MTTGNPKKISNINDELDVKLFLYITKKNILFLIVFIVIALTGSFIYLRYTQPLYQASSVIQISIEDRAKNILPTQTFFDEEDLAEKIELMRSQVFLERAFNKLPLDISYFSEGRFLNFELYSNPPFIVNADVKDNSIYGTPVYIDFIDKENYIISYKINDETSREKKIVAGKTFKLPEIEFDIEVQDFKAIVEQQSIFSNNSYFFIINNPDNIVAKHTADLKVNVLNAAAKTIEISYQGNNPRKASDIANSISEEFCKYELEKKTESADRILEFINSQMDLAYNKLSQSEIKIERFKKKHDISDDESLATLTSIHERIAQFENRIIQLDMEENIYTEIEKNLQQKGQTDVYKLVAMLSGSKFEGNISGMLSTLKDLLLEKEKLLYEVTPRSGQIESLNHQIDIQKKMIVESIASLKNNIRSRRKELNEKNEKYEQYIKEQRGTYSLTEFNKLKRLHTINERFYNQLVEKKAEHSISKAGFVSQSVILEKSTAPNNPISPNSQSTYFGSLLAAFFLGAGIILLRYLFYNEISSLNDITKYTNAPVLGVIPKYKKEIPQNQLLVFEKPKSLIAESLRSIRTNFQFINNEEGSKLITVTSTVASEGKTFFAINIAGIFAFINKKVIVIDLDMRRPKIHQGFDVNNTRGMSTILSGMDNAAKCIQSSKIDNLDFITAGPVPPNPSELILSEKMGELIAWLKKEYDFVIIDTPPVGIVTDGMKCLMMADYPVYIFKANYSKRMFLHNFNRLLYDNKISHLSLVLNSIDDEFSSYGYGKAYSYKKYSAMGYKNGYYEDDEDSDEKGTNRILRTLKKYLRI